MIDKSEQMDISRRELIAQLTEFIEDAHNTPLSELCRRGDYQNQPDLRYPQTKGEFFADSISTLLASQTWVEGENEPILDDMLSVASLLDTDVDRPHAWRELFDLNKLLHTGMDKARKIVKQIEEILKNPNHVSIDQLGSYVVGAMIIRDDIEDIYQAYPALEEVAELGAKLETLGGSIHAERVFRELNEKFSLIKKDLAD